MVFTQRGRYFFFDTDSKEASWTPSEELLERLKSLPEHVIQALFDPDCDEDILAVMMADQGDSQAEEDEYECEDMDGDLNDDEGSEEIEYDLEEEMEEKDDEIQVETETIKQSVDPSVREEEHQRRITAFIGLLMEKSVDPFRPWSLISQELSMESAFQAITSPKERESIFAAVSPELAERARGDKQQKLAEAKRAWQELLNAMTDIGKLPQTWTEYSRQLKRSVDWFKLLDHREMEKQYRAKLKDLRDRAITYNIRSNT